MKFEKAKPEFTPVVITLETQEELDVLRALLGAAGGNYADDLVYKLYRQMDGLSHAVSSDYWVGSLHLAE